MGLINAIMSTYLDNTKSTSEKNEPQSALEKYQDFLKAEKQRREERLEKEKQLAEEERKAEEKRAEERKAEEKRAEELKEERLEEAKKAEKIQAEKEEAEKRAAEIKAEKLEEEKKAAELTNDQVQRYMEELREDNKRSTFDTAEETLGKLNNDEELSEKDLKKILTMYHKKYGKGENEELINKADDKLCGEHKNSSIGKAAGKLIDEAQSEVDKGEQNGNTMNALKRTLQRSSKESINKAEDFVEAAMGTDKESSIAKLQKKYSEYTREDVENKLAKTYSLYTDDNIVDIIDMYS